jgi:copper chaperone CopZ
LSKVVWLESQINTSTEVGIGSANVSFDPDKATLDKIKEAIEEWL